MIRGVANVPLLDDDGRWPKMIRNLGFLFLLIVLSLVGRANDFVHRAIQKALNKVEDFLMKGRQ